MAGQIDALQQPQKSGTQEYPKLKPTAPERFMPELPLAGEFQNNPFQQNPNPSPPERRALGVDSGA
ncbi:hypothetical protein [Microbulbifer sp.]|uniref:hypothetical protein n=1 Tax=Microbulbifer sp. TaxID=1908541 RepID=UPI003F2B4BE4